jgi:DNA-binding XRE family transcriptional regulator
MITAAQLRAARGLLDWTRADLAKAANISPETVKNIEHGTFRPQENTAEAIKRAFSAHDVVFIENEGVQLRKDAVLKYEGYEGFKAFMDDLYVTAQDRSALDGSKPICVCNVDNNLFKQHLKEYTTVHVERMQKIEGLQLRILAAKKDPTHISTATYLKYKFMNVQHSFYVPFYVYGDKLAVINFDVENPPQIIVINSALVARSYRDQFEIMWNNAAVEPKE